VILLDTILSWFRTAAAPVTGHAPAPLEIDAEGWLHGDQVERWPSVRHYAEPMHPAGICWHSTSVEPGTPLWRRIQTYREGVDRASSWHFLVEADGRIYQSVSAERSAWHCRETPQWRSYCPGPGGGPNHHLIGIEMAATEACEQPGYSWPVTQLAAAKMLVGSLREHYDIQYNWLYLEHRQLDPARRGDPGPDLVKLLKGE
jgi:hypothetical protein